MPTFVDMPHGLCFDIEELLYYRVSRGDTWMEQYEIHSRPNETPIFGENLPDKYYEQREAQWQVLQPMKLLLHFKNGTELEIPDFEMKFLEKWFFPAIRQLEENTGDPPEGKVDTLGSVYFIQGEVTKLIKIGYTNDVQKRLKALQQSEELTLLKQIDEVTRAYETELHQRFSQFCARGEWFRPKKELLDFIHKGDKDD